ncbi:MAG: hypothetical protein LBS56_05865 [Propionibacteriaceae bacterium]|nr:hypothetical protein [Propionibacteriaceae bacterium]
MAIGPACRAVAQVVCGADGGVGGVVAIGPAWCVVPQVAGGRDEWSAVSG